MQDYREFISELIKKYEYERFRETEYPFDLQDSITLNIITRDINPEIMFEKYGRNSNG